MINPAGQRHRWSRKTVEVPWSSMPGNLYTCVKCGMTRQRVPDGGGDHRIYVVHEFTATDGKTTRGKTPPCQPAADAAREE